MVQPITLNADQIGYDNTTSGLISTDVQAAIDEVVSASETPDLTKFSIFDDMVHGLATSFGNFWTFIVTGVNGSVVQNSSGDRPGIVGIGALDSGEAGNLFTPWFSPYFNSSTATWTFEAEVILTQLAPSDPHQYQVVIGFTTTSGTINANDGIYFTYEPTVSANWRIHTADAGTRTHVTTSEPVVGSTWTKLAIVVAPNKASANFFVNGTNVGTITTNLPNTSTAGFISAKTSGTGATRYLSIDWARISATGLSR